MLKRDEIYEGGRGEETRSGGTPRRPRIATWPRDTAFPPSVLATFHVPRKFQIVSSPGSVIRPQLITPETVIGPLKAWVNVRTCRDEGRLKILRNDFDRQTTNATQMFAETESGETGSIFSRRWRTRECFKASVRIFSEYRPTARGGESRVFSKLLKKIEPKSENKEKFSNGL